MRARIGRQLGTEKIGLSLFEVPPGQAAYPYHWHVAEEELVIVSEGQPSLRRPGGWREVEPGEVLAFTVGGVRCASARQPNAGDGQVPGVLKPAAGHHRPT